MSIQHESGGWMRLEDYCNSTDRGTPFIYTSCILNIDDVVRDIELGDRAANQWLEAEVDHWDPLLDVLMEEMARRDGHTCMEPMHPCRVCAEARLALDEGIF